MCFSFCLFKSLITLNVVFPHSCVCPFSRSAKKREIPYILKITAWNYIIISSRNSLHTWICFIFLLKFPSSSAAVSATHRSMFSYDCTDQRKQNRGEKCFVCFAFTLSEHGMDSITLPNIIQNGSNHHIFQES